MAKSRLNQISEYGPNLAVCKTSKASPESALKCHDDGLILCRDLATLRAQELTEIELKVVQEPRLNESNMGNTVKSLKLADRISEGPLAWALIVWRCSLVFNSMDKIVSVFIHLLPGLVFFTIRWWDPLFFEAMHPEGTARRITWPYSESKSYLWTWLFFFPLVAYSVWQLLYFLIVNVLRRQRLLRDPEGTVEESPESKQHLVAFKWIAWRQ